MKTKSTTISSGSGTLGVQNTISVTGVHKLYDPTNTTTSTLPHIVKDFPERISVSEVGETIEIVYKQTEHNKYFSGYDPSVTKVFKIIYS